jgi:hypothetical protein
MDSQKQPIALSSSSSSKTKAVSTSTKSTFILGDAFVTATVETIKRKRTQQPTATKVRNIHDDVDDSSQETQKDLRKEKQQQQQEEDSSSDRMSYSSTISAVPRVSSTPFYTNRLPRPSSSTIAPSPSSRGMATSSLRPAAPQSTSSNYYNTYTPVSQSSSTATTTTSNNNNINNNNNNGGGGKGGKKKQLSRKRQMEQMLRAGRLDEVQGDHELQGVAHVYNAPTEYSSSSSTAAAAVDSIRVVPTGTYDPSTGTMSTSRDVTGTQKNKNQLNSLLANAAALENHRMQIGGGAGNSGNAYKATAKRKYGW